MRTVFFGILPAMFMALFLCAGMAPEFSADANAATAAKKAPKLKDMGGQKVENEYFDLTIPDGWSMPVPIKNMPQAGTTALFADMRGEPAVTVNVMKSDMPAKEIAEQTIANMKKGGIEAGELKEKDGLYYATLSGKVKGNIWFGSSNGIVSAVNIVGNNPERANVLLEALNPKVKGIFPKSVAE